MIHEHEMYIPTRKRMQITSLFRNIVSHYIVGLFVCIKLRNIYCE